MDATLDNYIGKVRSPSGKPRSPAQRCELAKRGHTLAQSSVGAGRRGQRLHWTKGIYLGEGAFSRVYLGLNAETGEFLAVKELFMDSLIDYSNKDSMSTSGEGSIISSGSTQNQPDIEMGVAETAVYAANESNASAGAKSQEENTSTSTNSKTNRMTKLEKKLISCTKLEHPNIVRYLGTEFVKDPIPQFCILLEYVPGGSVKSM